MRVTANAVRNNWQYNFAMAAGLFLWFVFACIVLLEPKAAMNFAARFGKFEGLQSPWLLAVLSFLPAFLIALPIGLIGRIVGIGVASRILSEPPQEPSAGELSPRAFSLGPVAGVRELHSERLLAAPASPSLAAPPSRRGIGSLVLRMVLGFVWMVALFVVGSLSISTLVMVLADGDQEARQQAVEAAGRACGVPLFFGSLILVVVLALLGWLPGFRRRKAASPARDAALAHS
jgi:hypothetical protein